MSPVQIQSDVSQKSKWDLLIFRAVWGGSGGGGGRGGGREGGREGGRGVGRGVEEAVI